MLLIDIVSALLHRHTRRQGELLERIKECSPHHPLSEAERTALSGMLAERYLPPLYGTEGAAKAAASQHAKAVWAISNELGDLSATSLQAFLESVDAPRPKQAASRRLSQRSIEERSLKLAESLGPDRSLMVRMRYGLGEFRRRDDASFGLASYHSISEVLGMTPEKVRDEIDKALRQCRHPSRSLSVMDCRDDPGVVLPRSSPATFLRDILRD